MTKLHTTNHIDLLNLSIKITISPRRIHSTYLSQRKDFSAKLLQLSEVIQ